jgi:imidazolonepropionase-like amidohydrolase
MVRTALVLISAVSLAAQSALAQIRAVRFGTLIDGAGSVLRDAVVTIEGERIVRVETGDRAVPPGAEIIDLRGYTGLPGLIDVHTHLTFYWEGPSSTAPWNRGGEAKEQAVARSLLAGHKTLESGVTTVRELGAYDFTDVMTRDRIEGGAVGPRMIVAGHGLRRARAGTQPVIPPTSRGVGS